MAHLEVAAEHGASSEAVGPVLFGPWAQMVRMQRRAWRLDNSACSKHGLTRVVVSRSRACDH